MSKCYLLFAEGFEECEGLVTLDILRRAGLEAYTVSIQDAHTVVGAHGVPITCDRTLPELLAAPPELVVLPGGMPGTTNLAKSPAVEALVRRTLEHGGRAAAICAAPSVLAQYALEIAESAHRFIHNDRVLGSAEEKSRLFLVQSTQLVLEDVLGLLGLFPIRAM